MNQEITSLIPQYLLVFAQILKMFRCIVFSILIAESISTTNGSVPGYDDLQSVEVPGEYGINSCYNM